MQGDFEVIYQMLRTVSEQGKVNAAAYGPYPDIWAEYTTLEGYVAEIGSLDRLFSTAASGKTRHKHEIETDLIEKDLYLSGPLFSLAISKKDPVLQALADLNLRKLSHLRDTELSNTSTSLISNVNLNIADLSGRGIVPEDVTEAEDLVQEFDEAMDNKEYSFGKRKAAKETMIETIGKARDLLENQLDRDMRIFKKKNPQLLAEYEAARVIKNIGIRHDPPVENPQTPTEQPS